MKSIIPLNKSIALGQQAEADAEKLSLLRELLLVDDRATVDDILRILNSEEEMERRTSFIIDRRVEHRLDTLKSNFKKELGEPVERILDKRLEASKEELLNILYPVMGKMIRKFISHQFQLLQEHIEARVRDTGRILSPRYILRRLRAKFFGISESEELLQELLPPSIDEVYLIQKGSGLLMGSYSRNNTLDQEVIAGMLTAIKSFAEDAFHQEGQELEMIEWQSYKIIIQNYYSYYLAVAMGGTISTEFKENTKEKLLTFAEEELKDTQVRVVDGALYDRTSSKLNKYFGS